MRRLKSYVFLLALLFLGSAVFGQNLEECRKVVNLTIEAINSKTDQKLQEKLSEDFSIAGQKGEIARLVLTQLFSQLNDQVTSFEESSLEINDSELTLKYQVNYESMGSKEATFIFNSENLLLELELFNMEVKTMNAETKVERPKQKLIEIPFTMSGNLISVKVILNGEDKNFILDTGSPKVILNSQYLEKQDGQRRISSSKGVSGNISGMDIQNVKELEFVGIKLINQDIITINLKHLEEELETEIHGLIGFDLIKDYDILFDYEARKITLILPEYFEIYKNEKLDYGSHYSVPIQMKSHIPVVECQLKGKVLRLGIDSGAETNLIDDDMFSIFKEHLKKIRTDELSGVNTGSVVVKKALVKNMQMGDKKFKNLSTVFSDISHLNTGYNLSLDGLIGYEVLSKQKTLISFERKEIIFID